MLIALDVLCSDIVRMFSGKVLEEFLGGAQVCVDRPRAVASELQFLLHALQCFRNVGAQWHFGRLGQFIALCPYFRLRWSGSTFGLLEQGIRIHPCLALVSSEDGFHAGAAVLHMPTLIGFAPLSTDGLGGGDQLAVVWKAQGDPALAVVVQRFQVHGFPIDGLFVGHGAIKIHCRSLIRTVGKVCSCTDQAFPGSLLFGRRKWIQRYAYSTATTSSNFTPRDPFTSTSKPVGCEAFNASTAPATFGKRRKATRAAFMNSSPTRIASSPIFCTR